MCPIIYYISNQFSVGLFDANGNPLRDTSVDVDDFGNPMPEHLNINNIQCSSLSRSDHTNCPQLTNSPTFGAALTFLDNQYFAPRATQSRFSVLTNLDDVTYFRQTDNDYATKVLYRPIDYNNAQEDEQIQLNKQKIDNKKKYGKEPNLLLKYNENMNKHRNGKTKDKYKNVNEKNNLFINNKNGNGNSNINAQVKTYKLDMNGRLTEDRFPINTNNNNNENAEGEDNIASVMDGAVRQLVSSMLGSYLFVLSLSHTG